MSDVFEPKRELNTQNYLKWLPTKMIDTVWLISSKVFGLQNYWQLNCLNRPKIPRRISCDNFRAGTLGPGAKRLQLFFSILMTWCVFSHFNLPNENTSVDVLFRDFDQETLHSCSPNFWPGKWRVQFFWSCFSITYVGPPPNDLYFWRSPTPKKQSRKSNQNSRVIKESQWAPNFRVESCPQFPRIHGTIIVYLPTFYNKNQPKGR